MSPARVTTIVWALAGMVWWAGYRPDTGVKGMSASRISVVAAAAVSAAPGAGAVEGQTAGSENRREWARRQVQLIAVMLAGVVLLFAVWVVYRRWIVKLKRSLEEREKKERGGGTWDAWEESARRIKTPTAEELEEEQEK